MNIASKIVNGVEPTVDELEFLLWCALIQLSAYSEDVHTVEEETFDIEQMLKVLDEKLGTHP